MKRIGIISLYCNNANYGALLQAYALCRVITGLGYFCKQISYDRVADNMSFIPKVMVKAEHLIKPILLGEWYQHLYKGIKLLKQFELSIPHTKEVDSITIVDLNKDFDAFICGSDQVWNPLFGWNDNHFLTFVDHGKKKIAYAASIARDQLTASEAEYVLNMIKDFYVVSLRERRSIESLREYDYSFHADVMPDPTLLLTQKEWNEVASNRIVSESYIFAFFLGNNERQKDAAIKYARNKGKRIVFIYSLLHENKKWEVAHESDIIPNISVNAFLSLIKYANLVITDSFHGAVFSSIFNVPFIVLNRFDDSDVESMNSRIVTLMDMLGINRNVKDIEYEKDYSFTVEEIKLINAAITYERKRGMRFLSEVLAVV